MSREIPQDGVADLIKRHKKGTSISFGEGINPLDSIVHITNVKGPSVKIPFEGGHVYVNGETMIFNTDHGLVAIKGGSLSEISLKDVKKLLPKKDYQDIRKALKDSLKERTKKKTGR